MGNIFMKEFLLQLSTYIEFLRENLPQPLEDIPLQTRISIIYQHDGAPAHNRTEVSAFWSRNFNMWSGNKANVAGEVCWFNAAGFLVVENTARSNTPEELREKITAAVNDIKEQQMYNRTVLSV